LQLSSDVDEGGVARCVRTLLDRLPDHGVETEAWVARPGPDPHPRVRCFRRAWEHRLDFLELVPGWTDWRHRGCRAALAGIRPGQFDVVHLHTLHNGAASIRAVFDLCRRVPAVWTLHDEWAATGGLTCDLRGKISPAEIRRMSGGLRRFVPYSPYHDSIRYRTTRRMLDLWMPGPRVVLTPSRHIADLAVRSGRFPGVEVRVVRNAVALAGVPETQLPRPEARARLGVPPNRPVVLMLAPHLQLPHKGIPLGVAALNRVSRSPHLLLIGSGAEGLRGALRCSALPPQGDAVLATAYRAADVTLVPSLAESFSLVAAESMACGTPVVGFAVGGLRELIGTGERGLAARPYSVAELAACLDRLLADPVLGEKLGAAGREWVRAGCDPDAHVRAVVAAYTDAAGGSK
jgi:glycosyltransferase involved in cell wall biosynthesis